MGDSGGPSPYCRQIIGEPPPPYAPPISPEPADAESSWVDETNDYGVLAVNSNQRHNAGEVDQADVERPLVEKPPQGSGSERVCSNYAWQNISDSPIISDCSFDTYGMVGLAACGAKKNDDEQEEDERDEETVLINWNPQTVKFMLPERKSALNRGFNLALQEVTANIGGSRAQEGERSAALSSGVLLQSVIVRQSSEEEAEAQAKLDTGVETGGKVENFLSEWGLVFAKE